MGSSVSKPTSVHKTIDHLNFVTEFSTYIQELDTQGRLCLTSTSLQITNELIDNLSGLETALEHGQLRPTNQWVLPQSGLVTRLDASVVWHIELIKTFIQDLRKVKIFSGVNSQFSRLDLTRFSSLRFLELRCVSIQLVAGLRALRSRLEALVVNKSSITIRSLFEDCGADQSFPGEWPCLLYLDLKWNSLTALDSSLRLLTRLTVLDLSRNMLTTTEGIEHLPRLERVNLSYNYISSFPVFSVEQQTNIKVLLLSFNQIEKLDGVDKLVNIEILDAQGNCIVFKEDINGLKELNNIVQLRLHGNPIAESPTYRHQLLDQLSSRLRFQLQIDNRPLSKSESLYLHKMPFNIAPVIAPSAAPLSATSSGPRGGSLQATFATPATNGGVDSALSDSLDSEIASIQPRGILKLPQSHQRYHSNSGVGSTSEIYSDSDMGAQNSTHKYQHRRRVQRVQLTEDDSGRRQNSYEGRRGGSYKATTGSEADVSSSEAEPNIPPALNGKKKANGGGSRSGCSEDESITGPLDEAATRTRRHIEEVKEKYKENWLPNFNRSLDRFGIPSPPVRQPMVNPFEEKDLNDNETPVVVDYVSSIISKDVDASLAPQITRTTPSPAQIVPFLSCLVCQAGFLETKAQQRPLFQDNKSSGTCRTKCLPDGTEVQLLCPFCNTDLIVDQNRSARFDVDSSFHTQPLVPLISAAHTDAVTDSKKKTELSSAPSSREDEDPGGDLLHPIYSPVLVGSPVNGQIDSTSQPLCSMGSEIQISIHPSSDSDVCKSSQRLPDLDSIYSSIDPETSTPKQDFVNGLVASQLATPISTPDRSSNTLAVSSQNCHFFVGSVPSTAGSSQSGSPPQTLVQPLTLTSQRHRTLSVPPGSEQPIVEEEEALSSPKISVASGPTSLVTKSTASSVSGSVTSSTHRSVLTSPSPVSLGVGGEGGGGVVSWLQENAADFSKVEHDLHLHLEMNVVDQEETIALLLKCHVVTAGRSNWVDGLVLITTKRWILLEIKDHTNSDLSRSIKPLEKSSLTQLCAIEVGLADQFFCVDFSKPGKRKYLVITGDSEVTRGFLHQFKGVLSEHQSDRFTGKLSLSSSPMTRSSDSQLRQRLISRFLSSIEGACEDTDEIDALVMARKHMSAKSKEKSAPKGDQWCYTVLIPTHVVTLAVKFDPKSEPEFFLDRIIEIPQIASAKRSSENVLTINLFETAKMEPLIIRFMTPRCLDVAVETLARLWTNIFMVSFECS